MSTQRIITQQRADTARMRKELADKISEVEAEEYAIHRGAGDYHPRAWVGPPFLYDIIGAMQFMLLLDLGLREHHRLLDVGCGSLRMGRFAIMYLLPGRYFGIEPERTILDEGCRINFGACLENSQIIQKKKPLFSHNTDFDFSITGGAVDFVIAQSIASHTGPAMTSRLLAGISAATHDDSIAVVTYIRCEDRNKSNTKEGWFYPECVTYTDEGFGKFAAQNGFHAYKTTWPLVNLRADGLITSQQPTILTKRIWKPTISQRLGSALFEGIVKIN